MDVNMEQLKKTMENVSFSPELLAMYQNYMSAAAATMITAFEEAAALASPGHLNTSLQNTSTTSIGLDIDIPREEIEYKIL